MAQMLALSSPLAKISNIQARFIPKLKRLGIETVRDLLYHFPVRYEDFSQIYKIGELIPNQEATVQGEVAEVSGRGAWRRHLYIVEALISDDSGSIRAVWFNQPYIKNILAPGRRANFSGKISVDNKGVLYLSNPTYELVKEHERYHAIHTGRIVPIYPETRGLTSKGIRYLIEPLLNEVHAEEPIPDEIRVSEGFPEINGGLRTIHFPRDIADALAAKKRFAFENLLLLQLRNIRERAALARERAPAIPAEIPRVKEDMAALPFALTNSQKRALWEILQDIAKPHPMNRLLQGDVGSGKTVLAVLAALAAARAGFQTAFMAPTEILARQHYRTFTALFPGFGGGAALLTGSEARASYGHGMETEMGKMKLKRDIGNGKIVIAFGTHALIARSRSQGAKGGLVFPNLALVVVDEQHRFGVRQRAALLGGNRDSIIPHFLSMSATPIPRTLSLTVFGDLDLSLITELPKNRKLIITKIVAPENRQKAYGFIRGEVRKGRQVFVICPRIETTNNHEFRQLADTNSTNIREIRGSIRDISVAEMKNVTEEYEKLSKKIFPDLRVAMLHGRMPASVKTPTDAKALVGKSAGKLAHGGKPTKEKVMGDFADGKIDILVATSVVEVGVDVPNASLMMIEGAERFGLAQLYQFRGRVGRGAHQSYCFLFTEAKGAAATERLRAVEKAKNGFELAERDLALRGPGEFMGKMQSGMPDIAMKAIQNPELVKRAREAAVAILERDPTLAAHPVLSARLETFASHTHRE